LAAWVGQLAREPLLHFFALGIGVFVLFGGRSGPGAQPPGEILVTRGTWQRPQRRRARRVDPRLPA
jgi:hypothetical protein